MNKRVLALLLLVGVLLSTCWVAVGPGDDDDTDGGSVESDGGVLGDGGVSPSDGGIADAGPRPDAGPFADAGPLPVLMRVDDVESSCPDAGGGWCRRAPASDLPYLRAVFTVSAADAWALGDGELSRDVPQTTTSVWRYQGSRWQRTDTLEKVTATALWGAAPDDLWIGFDDGALWRGGADGFDLAQQLPAPIVALWGAAPDVMFALTPAGEDASQVWRFTGEEWLRSGEVLAGQAFDLGGSSSVDVWALTSRHVARFDGAQWSVTSPGPDWQSESGRLAVIGANDAWILHWDPVVGAHESLHWDGATWTASQTWQPGNATVDAWSDGQNPWWLGGTLATYRDGAWDGVWLIAPLAHGHAQAPQNGWLVGEGIARLDASGWHLTTGQRGGLGSVWASSSTDIWAAGAAALQHGSATRWSTEPIADARAVFGFSAQDVWVGTGAIRGHSGYPGTNSAVLRKQDGAWHTEHVVERPVQLIHGSGPDDVFVATDRSLFRRSAGGWSSVGGLFSQEGGGPCPGQTCRLSVRVSALRALGNGRALVGSSSSPSRCVEEWVGMGWVTRCNPGLQLWDGTALVEMPGRPDLQRIGGIWASGPTDIWVFADGALWSFDGATWISHALPVEYARAGALAGTSAQDLWIAFDQRVFRWDGAEWHDESPPTALLGPMPRALRAIDVRSDIVIVVGDQGLVLERRR